MAKAPVGKKRPPAKRPPQRPNAARARAEAEQRRRSRIVWAIAASALVVVLVVVLIIVKVAGGSSSHSTSAPGAGDAGTPTAASVTAALASIPPAQLAASLKAAGNGVPPPRSISDPPLSEGGKPEVLYVGAGYCPYCAAERWAIVTALSKFGTFSGLLDTHSSSSDVNPNTPTFSFHGATYTSQYLAFTGVEQTTTDPNVPLDTATPAQIALVEKYTNGSIPFVYFGGKYFIGGAQYDGKLLAGKTVAEVAAQATDGSTSIGRGIQASAGSIVRVLCQLTGGQPGNVCSAFPSSGQ